MLTWGPLQKKKQSMRYQNDLRQGFGQPGTTLSRLPADCCLHMILDTDGKASLKPSKASPKLFHRSTPFKTVPALVRLSLVAPST